MAQVVSLRAPTQAAPASPRPRRSTPNQLASSTHTQTHTSLAHPNWASLQRSLKCSGRFTCLFSGGSNKQDQARKALESALGGKKTEFEKWDKEIKQREESGGGGGSSGGGWFGWGRWFGDFDGDRFWQEAQQTGLTVLGIVAIYLIVVKGDVMLAVIFNPLLFALRGTRNGLTLLMLRIMQVVKPTSQSATNVTPRQHVSNHVSAKESVLKKWGSD